MPPSLLALANAALATAVAFPIQASALSPDLVGISLSTTVSFTAGTAPADQAVVLASATAAAANYINNLAIGQPLVINQIAAQILGADARIQDVGQPNDEIPNIFLGWELEPGGLTEGRIAIEDSLPSQCPSSPDKPFSILLTRRQ